MPSPFALLNRQTIRAPQNPMDVATVVSIFPKAIRELKHTLQPGLFEMGPGSYEKPATLVVGSSSWWREIDPEQPLLEIPVSSIAIAESVVRDYCNGLVGCNMGDIMPGMFFIPGRFSQLDITKNHKDKLDLAAARQKKYWEALVIISDNLWAKSNGSPLTILNDSKLAADQLGLKDKPWMKDIQTLLLVNCPACGTLRNDNFPVCANCKTVIDKKKFTELGLELAK